MESNESEDETAIIREKRIQLLLGTWELLKARYPEMAQNVRLNEHLLRKVVEKYLQERSFIIKRNQIPNRINRPKIAGLMAVQILNYRPLSVIEDPYSVVSCDNQFFAIWHGIAICAETASEEQIANFRNSPGLGDWFTKCVHGLLDPPYSAEALVIMFETISLAFFPSDPAEGD